MNEPHALAVRALYRQFEKQDATQHSKTLLRLIREERVDARSAMLSHVLGDSWLDFAAEALSAHFSRTKGYVYIAATPQYAEVFKVGKTGRLPAVRAAELSGEAVLHSFKVTNSFAVHDRHYIERSTHALLREQGVLCLKEFFKATPAQLQLAVTQAIHNDIFALQQQGLQHCIPPIDE